MATCLECGGTGIIITCCDDICVGGGECIHGDGEEICPECGGEGCVGDYDDWDDWDAYKDSHPDEFDEQRVVSENGAPQKTKEDILKEKFSCLIGQSITVTDAAETYKIPRDTILEWKKKGYITVIKEGGRGSRMELDQSEVAYCADIYLRRKRSGVGFRAPLLDENGLEYQLKHPELSHYRRRKKAND